MQGRKTPSKVAILELLGASDHALSHEMIEQRLTSAINRSTIYRVLNGFVEQGVVHRIISEDGRQYFAICTNCDLAQHHDDHPHFQCITCDRVECLPQTLQIELPKGYRPESLNATVSGYCRTCSDQDA